MAGTLGQLSYDLEEVARTTAHRGGGRFVRSFFPDLATCSLRLMSSRSSSRRAVRPLILYSQGNEVLTVAVFDLQQNRREGVAAAVFSMMLLAAAGMLGLTRLISSRGQLSAQPDRAHGPPRKALAEDRPHSWRRAPKAPLELAFFDTSEFVDNGAEGADREFRLALIVALRKRLQLGAVGNEGRSAPESQSSSVPFSNQLFQIRLRTRWRSSVDAQNRGSVLIGRRTHEEWTPKRRVARPPDRRDARFVAPMTMT